MVRERRGERLPGTPVDVHHCACGRSTPRAHVRRIRRGVERHRERRGLRARQDLGGRQQHHMLSACMDRVGRMHAPWASMLRRARGCRSRAGRHGSSLINRSHFPQIEIADSVPKATAGAASPFSTYLAHVSWTMCPVCFTDEGDWGRVVLTSTIIGLRARPVITQMYQTRAGLVSGGRCELAPRPIGRLALCRRPFAGTPRVSADRARSCESYATAVMFTSILELEFVTSEGS